MDLEEEDDEGLRQAIAMSLKDAQSRTIISLDSDDAEDGDGVALRPPPQHAEHRPDTSSSSTLGLLGLDRARMEAERLSRKRKASISPPSDGVHTRKSQATVHHVQAHHASPQPLKIPHQSKSKGLSAAHLRYQRGTVRKTFAAGYPRSRDDITLDEVFEKETLEMAVLSSFQWDVPWLFGKLNKAKTLVTLVMQAKDDETKIQYRRETSYMPNLRLCFPNMEGQINCMHSKLILLSYPSHLRLAVPTANLVPYDWGETGTMENMVFLIDLPRMQGSDQGVETPFKSELIYFLKAKGLEQSIVDSLDKFDFAATKPLAFVHTIGGAHGGSAKPWLRTGYCGLGRSVEALGLATTEPITVDFVTSSVGSLNMAFLSSLYLACQGDDGQVEYNWRYPPTGKSKPEKTTADNNASFQQKNQKDVDRGFRVYFPTHNTVVSSNAGSAGTICFQSKWYDGPAFPRQVMRDCVSTRPGLLMHNKLLFVKSGNDGDSSSSATPSKSWAYIGSANCSESAWGRLTRDRTNKLPKLNCRNWECGVIIPTRSLIDHDSKSQGAHVLDGNEFDVPIPMTFPGEEYRGRQPWFYSE